MNDSCESPTAPAAPKRRRRWWALGAAACVLTLFAVWSWLTPAYDLAKVDPALLSIPFDGAEVESLPHEIGCGQMFVLRGRDGSDWQFHCYRNWVQPLHSDVDSHVWAFGKQPLEDESLAEHITPTEDDLAYIVLMLGEVRATDDRMREFIFEKRHPFLSDIWWRTRSWFNDFAAKWL